MAFCLESWRLKENAGWDFFKFKHELSISWGWKVRNTFRQALNVLIFDIQIQKRVTHRKGHVHEELPSMLQIEKLSKSFFWNKLITNRVISKKNWWEFVF